MMFGESVQVQSTPASEQAVGDVRWAALAIRVEVRIAAALRGFPLPL